MYEIWKIMMKIKIILRYISVLWTYMKYEMYRYEHQKYTALSVLLFAYMLLSQQAVFQIPVEKQSSWET